MTTTLITFLGQGTAVPGRDGYQRTDYRFAAGSRTSVFFGAALAEELVPGSIQLVGTRTSSWQALALDVLHDLDLAAHIDGERAGGPSAASLAALERGLQAAWSVPVACSVLPIAAAPDADQCTGIAMRLYRLWPDSGPVALDLTHGFRTLPMLAMAALHLRDAFHPGAMARTTLWYGELVQPGATPAMPARPGAEHAVGRALRLDGLQRVFRLAQAAAALAVNLDPEPLAELVRPGEPRLAQALDELGLILLAHDFTGLTLAPQRVLQHLQRLEDDHEGVVSGELHSVLNPLAQGTLGRRLIALASWARRAGRPALAVLAAYEGLVRIATRDAETAEADHAIAAMLAGRRAEADICDRLRRVRNQVAHGAQTARQEALPISRILDEALPVLRRLLD